MEQFLTSFYRWYVTKFGDEDSDWHKEPGKTIIGAAVTKALFQNFQRIVEITDCDPITYSQDVADSWPGNIVVQPLHLGKTTADYELRIGVPPDDVRTLKIGLRVERGAWRINSVKDMRTTISQGR